MKENAPILFDERSGLSFPRLDLLEAIKLAGDKKEEPIFWKTIPQNREIRQDSILEGIIFEAIDPNGNEIKYELIKNTCPIKFTEIRQNNDVKEAYLGKEGH